MTEKDKDEEDKKSTDKTMVQLSISTLGKMDKLRDRIKEKSGAQFRISNDLVLTVAIDCIDEKVLEDKIKSLKEIVSP